LLQCRAAVDGVSPFDAEKSEPISGKKSATDGNIPNSIAARDPAPCSALRQAMVDVTANNKYNGIVIANL